MAEFDKNAAEKAEQGQEGAVTEGEDFQQQRNKLESRLQTGVEIPEVAEFVYGSFARILIEIALAFLQWSMMVFHYQILSYSLVEVSQSLRMSGVIGAFSRYLVAFNLVDRCT